MKTKVTTWIGLALTIGTLLVGGTWVLAKNLSTHATQDMVQRQIEAHEKATHEGTERALENLRRKMDKQHNEMLQILRQRQ